jgi:hypothetical protein
MVMAAAQFAAYWRGLEMVALVLVGVDPKERRRLLDNL